MSRRRGDSPIGDREAAWLMEGLVPLGPGPRRAFSSLGRLLVAALVAALMAAGVGWPMGAAAGEEGKQVMTSRQVRIPPPESPPGGGDDFCRIPEPWGGAFPPGVTATTIPFELREARVVVQVQVDGQGPLPFRVDLDGPNLLTPATAVALGLVLEDGRPRQGLPRAGELTLGELCLRDVPFVLMAPRRPPWVSEETAPVGQLGLTIFEPFVVTFDYPGRRLTVSLPWAGSPAADPPAESPADPPAYSPEDSPN